MISMMMMMMVVVMMALFTFSVNITLKIQDMQVSLNDFHSCESIRFQFINAFTFCKLSKFLRLFGSLYNRRLVVSIVLICTNEEHKHEN